WRENNSQGEPRHPAQGNTFPAVHAGTTLRDCSRLHTSRTAENHSGTPRGMRGYVFGGKAIISSPSPPPGISFSQAPAIPFPDRIHKIGPRRPIPYSV